MNYEQEAKLKECAVDQCAQQSAPMGYGGTANDPEPCRASLRERVSMDLSRSCREARKRDRLEELSYLLDKNPEIARILDLIEDVR